MIDDRWSMIDGAATDTWPEIPQIAAIDHRPSIIDHPESR
jgi:hypothetical protein